MSDRAHLQALIMSDQAKAMIESLTRSQLKDQQTRELLRARRMLRRVLRQRYDERLLGRILFRITGWMLDRQVTWALTHWWGDDREALKLPTADDRSGNEVGIGLR